MKRYKFTGAQIFNMDESGFNTVQKPPKVLAEKGKRTVAVLTSAERGINVAVVCCTSATGQFVPHHYIFPLKNFTDLLMAGAPTGSIGSCTESG